MTRPSGLGLAAAAIAAVVDAGYVAILLAEDEGDTMVFAAIIGMAVVAAVAGSLAARPGTRVALLGAAAVVFAVFGVLGIFSIGLPLLLAAALAGAGCAATAGRRQAPEG